MRRVLQALLWTTAGVTLSPTFGAPIWALTGENRANDALPWATAVIGGGLGLIALNQLPHRHRDRGATIFGAAYLSMLPWWVAWVERGTAGFLWFIGLLCLCIGLIAVVGAAPPRPASELRKLAAGAAWVVTLLAMPIYLMGLVVLPLGVSLTIVARRGRTIERFANESEPRAGHWPRAVGAPVEACHET